MAALATIRLRDGRKFEAVDYQVLPSAVTATGRFYSVAWKEGRNRRFYSGDETRCAWPWRQVLEVRES